MKARSLLAASLALLIAGALPILAQQTPETPSTDSSTQKRVRIRINDKVVKVDSIDSRMFESGDLDFEDADMNFDDGDMNFDGDLDMNFQFDSANGNFNFQMNGRFDRKEFQEKMQQFQQRMQEWQQRFQEKMQQWQEKNQERMKLWQEKLQERMKDMDVEMESMNDGGDDSRVLRLRSGDSSVLVIGRTRRLGVGNSAMSQAVDANAKQINDINSRINGITQELKRLPKNDPRRAKLSEDLDRTRAELKEIQGLNEQLQMIIVNGNSAMVFSNGEGSAFNVAADGEGFAWANGGSVWGNTADDGEGSSEDCFVVHMDCDTLKGGAKAMSVVTRSRRDGKAAKNFLMRAEGDNATSMTVTPRLMIKTIAFSGDQNAISPADQVFNDQTVQLHRSEVVIAGDTIGLDDGREGQTVIRIDRGQSADGTTQVVIMTLRRGAGRDAARSSSAPVAPSAAGFALGENFPNPASESTTIEYTAPKAGHVNIGIFDNTGRLVKTALDKDVDAGTGSVVVNTSDLPNGLYLYRMVSGGYSEAKTMTVTR